MRHGLATTGLALIALLAWWCLQEDSAATRSDRHEIDPHQGLTHADGASLGPALQTPVTTITTTSPPTTGAALPEPRSLRGTEVDGALSLDAQGRFLPDGLAIRLFDYFLSTEGEITLAEIRQLVEAEARRRVTESEVDAVMALFDRYLDYRQAAERVSRGVGEGDLKAYHQALMALQAKTFGPATAERMFGETNLLATDAIARREVLQNEDLDWEQKATELAELDAKLPAPVRKARERIRRPQEVAAVVAQMRQDGLGDDEVFAYRADEFGAEAAGRLARLDQERAAWNARLDAYRTERDQILARQRDDAWKAQALQQLREAHFEGTEVTRVRVLDEMQLGQAR